MKTNELESYSWRIFKKEYCIKIMDKSFYEYGETVIPIGIRTYFNIEHNNYGDKIDIFLLYKGKEYKAVISFENNFDRSKLRICKDLHKKLVDNLKCYLLNYNNYNKVHLVFNTKENQKFELKIIYEV